MDTRFREWKKKNAIRNSLDRLDQRGPAQAVPPAPREDAGDVEFDFGWNVARDQRARVNGTGWSPADLLGTRKCKWCDGPIHWGQVESDTADEAARGRWMPLDPDLFPHRCRRSKVKTAVPYEDGTQ